MYPRPTNLSPTSRECRGATTKKRRRSQSQFEAKAKIGTVWKQATCGREPNFFTSHDRRFDAKKSLMSRILKAGNGKARLHRGCTRESRFRAAPRRRFHRYLKLPPSTKCQSPRSRNRSGEFRPRHGQEGGKNSIDLHGNICYLLP